MVLEWMERGIEWTKALCDGGTMVMEYYNSHYNSHRSNFINNHYYNIIMHGPPRSITARLHVSLPLLFLPHVLVASGNDDDGHEVVQVTPSDE